MVQSQQGILVACDVPIKQYLLMLDSTEQRFIQQNLDETHLFIEEWAIPVIKKRLEDLYEENEYTFIK